MTMGPGLEDDGAAERADEAPCFRAEVAANLAAAGAAAAALGQFLKERVGEDDRHAVELGVAEALTNIVEHGLDGYGAGLIDLTCLTGPDLVEVLIRDTGRPIPEESLARAGSATFEFDPNDLENLPEGGLGLALVKTLFDSVGYRQAGGLNQLHLVRQRR